MDQGFTESIDSIFMAKTKYEMAVGNHTYRFRIPTFNAYMASCILPLFNELKENGMSHINTIDRFGESSFAGPFNYRIHIVPSTERGFHYTIKFASCADDGL